MKKILFQNADRTLNFKDKNKLKSYMEKIFEEEKLSFSFVHYIFCSDEYLLKINQQYLKHDYYTDIITFNLAEINTPIEGEVYISLDRVKDNARELHQPLKTEKLRVLFHGILHLCGYKDKKPDEEKLMRKKENDYINGFFEYLQK